MVQHNVLDFTDGLVAGSNGILANDISEAQNALAPFLSDEPTVRGSIIR
jgi:hypothetical protein